MRTVCHRELAHIRSHSHRDRLFILFNVCEEAKYVQPVWALLKMQHRIGSPVVLHRIDQTTFNEAVQIVRAMLEVSDIAAWATGGYSIDEYARVSAKHHVHRLDVLKHWGVRSNTQTRISLPF